MVQDKRGFTLIEVIVVAAIIAILAGILIPMIFNQIDESKVTRAKGDIKSIQTAILAFRKDTGEWPLRDSSTTKTASILWSSQGSIPTGLLGWDQSKPAFLEDALITNGTVADPNWYTVGNSNSAGWKGPYAATFPADPWGNKYVINIKNANTSEVRIFILSAGSDGKIDTELPGDTTISGADIGEILLIGKSP